MNIRAERMARGGAAPGLKGQPLEQLPRPSEPAETDGEIEGKRAIAEQREIAITELMADLNLTREEAEEFYNKQRARSDKPMR